MFKESWWELEEQSRKQIVNPQQENDVVCFLYHALAKRLEKKGWPLHLIRTEDTRYIGKRRLRVDINLNDRLFVEVKIYPLGKYSNGWKAKLRNIEYTIGKLEEYKTEVESRTGILVRIPILALWFWKNEDIREYPIKDKLIRNDLLQKLKSVRAQYKGRFTIMYGPTED